MKDFVVKAIKKALDEENIKVDEKDILMKIEIPKNKSFGDYAFPCFFLEEKLKENPSSIAIKLREKIGNAEDFGFKDIQTKGPYINFFLDRNLIALKTIKEILIKKENFGETDLGKGKKVLIEHTSLNPNSSPHVGRARNAIIGDSIVRIFRFLGYNVEVHYYVNDVSKQVALLVVAGAENQSFKKMMENYTKIYNKLKKSKKIEKDVFLWLQRFEKGDKEAKRKFNKITKTCIEGQKKIMENIGIKYDFFDYESSFLEESKKIISELEKIGKLKKDKFGRLYLDQSENQEIKSKMKTPFLVLTRSDGTGLYPLRDIAYTIFKLKNADKNIVVLGEDQKLYFLQLKDALKTLNYEAPEVIHYSYVLLSSKGKLKKMSTRKGEVVLLEDFLEEAIKKAKLEIKKRKTKGDPKKIAIAAIKYRILKVSPDKSINFNLDNEIKFEGNTGPYLLYSYARARSILRKAKEFYKKRKNINIENLNLKELNNYETNLVLLMSNFQDVVNKAYSSLDSSIIASYSFEISKAFNEFYQNCQVIGSHEEDFRLALVEAFSYVLKNSLMLLGIETIEEM
ncbi:MAG: arginine--tRNA ligase [Candidatus Parcubacteria bacterium]|nr:MAG: arginine--tRNA ligase [Candidatus Parcubacteria bacterium]